MAITVRPPQNPGSVLWSTVQLASTAATSLITTLFHGKYPTHSKICIGAIRLGRIGLAIYNGNYKVAIPCELLAFSTSFIPGAQCCSIVIDIAGECYNRIPFGSLAEQFVKMLDLFSAGEEDRYTINAINEILELRLDPTVFGNACQILGLSEEEGIKPDVVALKAKYLIDKFTRKLDQVASVYVPVIQRMIDDVNAAVKTLNKTN